jgi:hypothetical protein
MATTSFAAVKEILGDLFVAPRQRDPGFPRVLPGGPFPDPEGPRDQDPDRVDRRGHARLGRGGGQSLPRPLWSALTTAE